MEQSSKLFVNDVTLKMWPLIFCEISDNLWKWDNGLDRAIGCGYSNYLVIPYLDKYAQKGTIKNRCSGEENFLSGLGGRMVAP